MPTIATGGRAKQLLKIGLRSLVSIAGVGLVTFAAYRVFQVNATTAGFAYLLLVLVIASTWGFAEACMASLAATLLLNLCFLPPIGKLTIYEKQNWVALFSFLATSLIASRLSAKAERRTRDAIARRQDVEHLYTFSRAILLIEESEPFAHQLAQRLAEIFPVDAVVLYDRATDEIYRAGPSEFDGMDDQLRDAARHGGSFSDAEQRRVITAVRLGSEPIAALGVQGAHMPDSVLQGIANLVAIGLERARAQDLAHQIEAARRSEQLRTTLLDALAHEFKTPLTSIKAATTSLLANPDQPQESRTELLTVADEEADRLEVLVDDAVEMARLSNADIDLHKELVEVSEVIRELVASMHNECDRRVRVIPEDGLAPIALDKRLVRLAVKQILDNALKYSPAAKPVEIRVHGGEGSLAVDVTDHGKGISAQEQVRIFERFYRGPAIRQQIPGSGLGLSIASSIAQAHGGDLTVTSRPGETTFRITLPVDGKGERN
ncbi:MAG: ATP-binding protein [Bryobacteraceae bacterium]